MPVLKCPNGKYRIGTGQCMYTSKASAERAYAGYRAHEHMNEDENPIDIIKMDVPFLIRLLELAREDLKDDMIIHTITEKLVEISRNGNLITMDQYSEIENLLPKESNESLGRLVRLSGIK